jgi:hypothetical protein
LLTNNAKGSRVAEMSTHMEQATFRFSSRKFPNLQHNPIQFRTISQEKPYQLIILVINQSKLRHFQQIGFKGLFFLHEGLVKYHENLATTIANTYYKEITDLALKDYIILEI